MATTTPAKVLEINTISEEIKEYIIKPDTKAPYEAGQFLQFSLDQVSASNYWTESRTFSIASYGKETLRLIIKKVGGYTKRIFNELVEGSIVTIKYAYGDFVLPFDDGEDVVCIAGGTGITPFLSFVDCLEERKLLRNLKILYSVKTKQEALYYHDMKDKLGEGLALFTTREENNGISYRRIALKDISMVSTKKTQIYICGSNDFNQYYKNILEKMGYENLHIDEW